MSYLKRLAKETAIYGGSSILARVLNYLLLSSYLTYKLENLAYGVHSIYYALAALLIIVYTFRFETAFFRFGSKKGQLERSFSTASIFLLGLALSFTLLLIWQSEPIAEVLTFREDARFVRWFALIIAADALAAIPFARLRLENRPIRFAIIKSFSVLMNILLVLFLLEIWPHWDLSGWGLPGYHEEWILDYVFLANLGASMITIFWLSPLYVQSRWVFDMKIWKRMMRYAWPLLIVGMAGTINLVFDKMLLKWLLPYSDEENIAITGVYAACMRIAILMNLVSQAYNYAAEPFFFKEFGSLDAKEKYARTAQAFALIAAFSVLAIALNLDWIKYLISPDKWGDLALVPVALLAYFFLGMYYNFSVWYKVTDHTLIGAGIALIGAIITIGVNFLLVPIIGSWGAVLATLSCFAMISVLTYLLGQRYYPVPYPVGKMVLYILTAAAVFGLSLWVDHLSLHVYLKVSIKVCLLFLYGIGWLFAERHQYAFLWKNFRIL
jgi:O-antigen/teichoic acid export membrane protein